MRKLILWLIIIIIIIVAGVFIWKYVKPAKQEILHGETGTAGKVKDEAALAGRTAESLPGADEDYYADMDYGVSKDKNAVYARLKPFLAADVTPDQAHKLFVQGRNNWIVWTAGNDRLWDILSVRSIGQCEVFLVPVALFERDLGVTEARDLFSSDWCLQLL